MKGINLLYPFIQILCVSFILLTYTRALAIPIGDVALHKLENATIHKSNDPHGDNYFVTDSQDLADWEEKLKSLKKRAFTHPKFAKNRNPEPDPNSGSGNQQQNRDDEDSWPKSDEDSDDDSENDIDGDPDSYPIPKLEDGVERVEHHQDPFDNDKRPENEILAERIKLGVALREWAENPELGKVDRTPRDLNNPYYKVFWGKNKDEFNDMLKPISGELMPITKRLGIDNIDADTYKVSMLYNPGKSLPGKNREAFIGFHSVEERHMINTWVFKDYDRTPETLRSHPSDIAYTLWRTAHQRKTSSTAEVWKLDRISITYSINGYTKFVSHQARAKFPPDSDGVVKLNRNSENQEELDMFNAMLGTPNVAVFHRMLADHRNEFKDKRIQTIYINWVKEKNPNIGLIVA